MSPQDKIHFAGDYLLAMELVMLSALIALTRSVPTFKGEFVKELDLQLTGPLPSPGVATNIAAIRDHVEKGER
jgi:hypothetical protein